MFPVNDVLVAQVNLTFFLFLGGCWCVCVGGGEGKEAS